MSLITLTAASVRSRSLPIWKQLHTLFIEWRQRVRSRCELAMLEDRQLWDAGLTRMDACNECEKPFWRA